MKKISLLLVTITMFCAFTGCAEKQEEKSPVPPMESAEEPSSVDAEKEPEELEEIGNSEVQKEPEQNEEPEDRKAEESNNNKGEEKKPSENAEKPTEVRAIANCDDIKAMWLSQYDLTAVYMNGGSQREQSDFTQKMSNILDNVKNQGFNTIFLQIRPNADSMYPSNYYPMSAYVTGKTGGKAAYDPVDIIVNLAHEKELFIHAWMNPMRGMAKDEILAIDKSYPIRQWYENKDTRDKYIVLVNGRWYLNPAYDEVAALIVNGAREVLSLYNFDGLHMDDYFYPITDSWFDASAYAKYQANGGKAGLADFRRNALNNLVKKLYGVTKESKVERIFGISPAGNVDTVYNKQYADIYTWCKNGGYIDYICPQVYFGLEHGTHDFVKVCRTYQSMIQTDEVALIVGMTFEKAKSGEDKWAGKGKNEWKENKDVLERCLKETAKLEKCEGVSVFCYQYFFHPITGKEVAETKEERANFVPELKQIEW